MAPCGPGLIETLPTGAFPASSITARLIPAGDVFASIFACASALALNARPW
jgi:hypothetical protein